jgi:hypothetical protein
MPPSLFLNIQLNTINQSTLWTSKFVFSYMLPHHNSVYISPTLPRMLLVPPISFFSIWSPEQYLVWSVDYYAPHYVVFSNLLLPLPS